MEAGGLVVIEMESADLAGSWQTQTGFTGSTGAGYITWTGSQQLGTPGVSTLRYPIRITTPGTYVFEWRNAFGAGTSPTDHNDTWLKIEADAFYGSRTGSVVCPKGYDASQNACAGAQPEGAGANGWFKVYRSGGSLGTWNWHARTSDNDPHTLYARFDAPGTYAILVSARSSSHAVDRMVLSIEGYAGNPQDTTLPESPRDGRSTSGDEGASEALGLSVHPNPASRTAVVQYGLDAAGDIDVALLDALGRDLTSRVLAGGTSRRGRLALDVSSLPPGTYLLRLISGNDVASRVLVVAR